MTLCVMMKCTVVYKGKRTQERMAKEWRNQSSPKQDASQQGEFKNQSFMLQTLIKEHGHECIFLPKFHCELNPIEMVSVLFSYYSLFDKFCTVLGMGKVPLPRSREEDL